MAKIPKALRNNHRPFQEVLLSLAPGTGSWAGRPEINIEAQKESLWCWAAVAQFILAVFGRSMTQGEIAAIFYGQCKGRLDGVWFGSRSSAMPAAGAEGDWDSFEDLGKVLACFKLLAESFQPDWNNDQGLVDIVTQRVLHEVEQGRPVGGRVGVESGVGHAIVISGSLGRGAGVSFEVMDPAAGEIRYMVPKMLFLGYACWGAITHLYYTRSVR